MKPIRLLHVTFHVLIISTILSCNSEQENRIEEGFSLSMNIASNPQTANPLYYGNSNEILICRHLFQPLLSINDSFNAYIPILAKELPEQRLINGETVFHYKLKSEAKWNDGSSLSAHDVALSYKIVFNPHSELPYLQDYYSFIDSIVVINDLEFDIYSNSSAPNILFRTGDFDILPKYIFDSDADLDNYSIQDLKLYKPDDRIDSTLLIHGQKMVNLKILKSNSEITGTGPYTIKEYNINQNVTLTKKENWWGQQFSNESYLFKSNPEKIILKIYMDPLPARMDFSNSKLDVLFGLNHETMNEINNDEALMEKTQIESYPINAFVYLAINSNYYLFKDKNVRKAIAMLADPEVFIREFLDKQAEIISSPISKSNSILYNSNLTPLAFDSEICIAWLNEAGWIRKNGSWFYKNEEITIDFLVQSGNKNSEDFAIFFKSNAAKIGLKINLMPMEFSTYISKIREGDFALSRLGTSTAPMFDNYRSLFHSSSIGQMNYPRIENEKIDSLIEKIELEHDSGVKKPMIWELQKSIFEEYNYVFLYSPIGKVYFNKNLGGLTLTADALKPWPPAFTRN